jgi:hypothetical protein
MATTTTLTPTADLDKAVVSAQAGPLTIADPSGTPAEGQGFVIALRDSGSARALTWGAGYRPIGAAALPTTTIAGKWMYIPVERNQTDELWDVMPVSQQA